MIGEFNLLNTSSNNVGTNVGNKIDVYKRQVIARALKFSFFVFGIVSEINLLVFFG